MKSPCWSDETTRQGADSSVRWHSPATGLECFGAASPDRRSPNLSRSAGIELRHGIEASRRVSLTLHEHHKLCLPITTPSPIQPALGPAVSWWVCKTCSSRQSRCSCSLVACSAGSPSLASRFLNDGERSQRATLKFDCKMSTTEGGDFHSYALALTNQTVPD